MYVYMCVCVFIDLDRKRGIDVDLYIRDTLDYYSLLDLSCIFETFLSLFFLGCLFWNLPASLPFPIHTIFQPVQDSIGKLLYTEIASAKDLIH